MAAIKRFTLKVWQSFLANAGHDANVFGKLEFQKVRPGEVVVALPLERKHLNRNMTLHGGVIVSLTDTLGSMALTTRGLWQTGVSVDIHTSFLRPAGVEGDVIHAMARVESFGKTLASTRVEFYNSQGKLTAFGSHTKFIGASLASHKNVKFSEDGETVIEGNDDGYTPPEGKGEGPEKSP
ncbi:Thioesterase/thiol ester dehydrase-isomerase [Dacryopinax primogenitus]|uniref:Thioesterase/thiol ester dehydrase-isomerase n=1 Tax=Dacryopinax primogenitus (strain DJM 731) TaxID=1858805 RepID=M5GEL1_DACPD|nr:Thioesterase/thiol ester dehydrase-isomerase [Dacryopinax primogenitus]EJU03358.1 Thioesterase/thiol ester dehydrase-isomerase [Dacryopinax primogenitus]